METLILGTYGEALDHVTGRGSGLYVLRFDRPCLTLLQPPAGSFFNRPQLGGEGGIFRNPTYLSETARTTSGELVLYVVDERVDAPGVVGAVRVDEATGELRQLGGLVPASDVAGGAACCYIQVSPSGEHVVAANYLGGSIVCIARNPDGSLDAASAQYLHLPPSAHPVKYPGANRGRQGQAHAHMALFSSGSSGVTVLVPDLGSGTCTRMLSPPNRAISNQSNRANPCCTFASLASASTPSHPLETRGRHCVERAVRCHQARRGARLSHASARRSVGVAPRRLRPAARRAPSARARGVCRL